ncbi:queuine/other tRNA-ribosyltransferase [Streptomyces sp. 3MP-14]|uniref:Queuine/other tRNA-ribosyltransferase n=1 Tax=Streptomyces mimosae TaxID=2586635 RepID=A0A5N6ASV2_9ACTN|nr:MULTISPECIES: tRNA-guanine transglycosylase DpdA [Streptomyces]KAB8170799.1 queuine/other tRNA-ribosyltransferase [Streptomyces mimosae]KAB8179848.1 queuine/other tRNA-ribosyltransferase [Streptomyces sp. 3MP-14]
MKFYFPDSQDQVSPTYDFINDEYSPYRVRQRDDLYAHQAVTPSPYDGILVSKAIVDGSVKGAGKYSAPQRERLYRLGVREFFRLPVEMRSLGDCGAFNYINEEYPPYSVEQVLDFYYGCRFDAGISIDHVIFGYDPNDVNVDPAWVMRREISLKLAEEFIAEVRSRNARLRTGEVALEPVGAAQGWSPSSYADSVARLQRMGYRRVALGGMVPLKTHEIVACLEEIGRMRADGLELHLLGITRIDSMEEFAKHNVSSFDSTSAFRQAFMDERSNYHTADGAYTAVRVPQVDGNPTLKRLILAGVVSQADAIKAERQSMRQLRRFDQREVGVDEVMDALRAYQGLLGDEKKLKQVDRCERTLIDRPWERCPCALCREHQIEMVIFRGSERNKRRGFHNLTVLEARMRKLPFS